MSVQVFSRVSLVAAVIAGGGAVAQTNGGPVAAPTDTGPAEIVVTANKRPEQLRKVPESVSVVTGAELQAEHIQGFPDLSRALPSLSFSGNSGQGEGLSNIEIRGISSGAGQSTVGVYLDDISLTTRNLYSTGVTEPKFFDVNRIEVLRGPQGTLYGASSEGGVIKIITNQPKLGEVSAIFTGEVSGTDGATGPNLGFTAIANSPLGDHAAVRLGYQYGYTAGYVNLLDPVTQRTIKAGVNAERDNVVRAAIRIEPNDRLVITPSLFYQHITTSDIDNTYLNNFKYNNLSGTNAPNVYYNNYTTTEPLRQPGLDELVIPSLTATYDAGFADITSVTSYFYRNFPRVQDSTYVNIYTFVQTVINDPATAAQVGHLTSPTFLNNAIRQTSQELRIASKPYDQNSGLPIDWVTGVYVSDELTTVGDYETIPGLNAVFRANGLNPNDPNAVSGSFPGAFPASDAIYFSNRRYETTQYAAFGELTYHVTPTVRLTGGLRYLIGRDNLNRVGDLYVNSGRATSATASYSYALTPKFAVSWDVTPEHTVYSNIAKGFRLGSVNRPIPLANPTVQFDLQNQGIAGNPPAGYGPDKLWNYEAGVKSRLLDGRLTTTLAGFYIHWTGIQQDVQLLTSGFDYETNVGAAESFGGEFEARFRATDQLTVGASGSYSDAHLTTPLQGIAGIKSGTWLQGAPRYNALLDAVYNFEVGDVPLFVRGDVRFLGNSHGSLQRSSPDYHRPAYFLADASVGGTYREFDVSLFVRNLTNQGQIIQRPNVQSVFEATRPLPLTVGLDVSRAF